MEQVTQREAQAWGEGDQEKARYCRKIEKKFLEQHLIKWIPEFCEKVKQEAELPFYRDMGALTKRFLELEQEEVKG